MKAITIDRYGPPEVLTLADQPRPEIGPNEVLIRVHASSVTTADMRMRASDFPGGLWLAGRLFAGLTRPRHKVPGMEFAGEVAEVGADVTRFRPGDRVFGMAPHGAHAEYIALPENAALAQIPQGLDFASAAALPFGGVCALVFLRDTVKLQPGQKVLIVGASGGVGTYAVQIARHFGAEVTAMAGPGRDAYLRGLGADWVLDYTVDDITAAGPYDVIFDTVGTTSLSDALPVLTKGGHFVPLNFGLREIGVSLMQMLSRQKPLVLAVNGDKQEDVIALADLVESGALRPVIDRRFPLDQIVDAHRYVEGRHRQGSVIIDVHPTKKAASGLAA